MRKHSKINCSNDNTRSQLDIDRDSALLSRFYNIVQIVGTSKDHTDTLHRVLDAVEVMLFERNTSSSYQGKVNNHEAYIPNVISDILSPPHVSRVGRRRKKRLQSTVDKIVKNNRKRKESDTSKTPKRTYKKQTRQERKTQDLNLPLKRR
ncbi:hypothetical protein PIB30_080902 [Stylosanthes scabra]|uniref:Uncharacterized protein n=1 Tax=Stylosanthes scabra TaxID=79078 RepID=A0ABU6VV52_9FABA|nr:hypothetical protein [Stylosanthes scabra]